MLKYIQKSYALLDRSTRWRAVVLGFMIVIGSSLEGLSVGLIFPFIRLFQNPSEIEQMAPIAWLFSTLNFSSDTQFLVFLTAIILLIFWVKNAFTAFIIYWQSKFTYDNEALLARRLLNNYLQCPYPVHLKRSSSELIRNVNDAVGQIFSNFILAGIILITELTVVLAIGIVILVSEPLIAVSAAIFLGAGSAVFYVLFRKKFSDLGSENLELEKQILANLKDSLGGIKEIKVFGKESFFYDKFSSVRNFSSVNKRNTTFFSGIPRLFIEIITVTGLLLVIGLILLQGRHIGESIAVLGLFAAASFRLIPSINRIIASLNSLRYGRAAVDFVFDDVFNLLPETQTQQAAPASFGDFNKITLADVSFVYPESGTASVSNINLTITKGTSIGLVGQSGAGKTTLVNILLGLLAPTQGKLLVDGKDIFQDLKNWQANIGYIPQSIYLIDDSIRRNIAFGLNDAEIDERKLDEAVTLARLGEFFAELPKGLDTQIGENGVRLSGGQRQRIGIARALYHQPKVIVMDEATSSLDSHTEQEITSAIDQIGKSKTLVIIAHRLSTVQRCEQLIFMEDGKISEVGTFQELMERSEKFCQLAKSSEFSASVA